MKTKVERYITRYLMEEYGKLNAENVFVGKFLFKHVNGKTLDFGCGPSLLYWTLFMKKATLIDAFDIVPENILHIRKSLAMKRKSAVYYDVGNYIETKMLGNKTPKFVTAGFAKINKLEVADMLKPLPFQKSFYDCVTEIGCIGCVSTHEELVTAVKNIYACLKVGGKVVIINWTGKRNKNKEEVSYFDGTVKISKSILEKVFFDVGFKKVDIHYKNNEKGLEYSNIIYGIAIK